MVPADHIPVILQPRNPLPNPGAGNRSQSVSPAAPAATGELCGSLSPLGWAGGSHRGHTEPALPCPGSDSDSDVDRISEWKRRDEERRRELEEKRKREQEEEIRRLREQEKEEKEKRKEKAEKGEEVHSDSDSSAEDEAAKKGRRGRAKAPSSSDSELEQEKEVSVELCGLGGAGTTCHLHVRPSGTSRSGRDVLSWLWVTLQLPTWQGWDELYVPFQPKPFRDLQDALPPRSWGLLHCPPGAFGSMWGAMG